MAIEVTKTDSNYRELWKDENVKEYMEAVFEKLADLLLEELSQLEPYMDGDIKSFQKTFKDGEIISGREASDIQIIYESNMEASTYDKDFKRTILYFLEWTHPDYISIEIAHTALKNKDEPQSPPKIFLKAPSRGALNIDKLISEVGLLDTSKMHSLNLSQFMKVDSKKSNINRRILSEHLDPQFSELVPITLGHLIEEFKSSKDSVPLFSYRTEDFFEEYNNSTEIPMEYRIDKLFEQFENVKEDMSEGTIPPGPNENKSIVYLIQEAAKNLTSEGVPTYTPEQLEDLLDAVKEKDAKIAALHQETGSLKTERDEFSDQAFDFDKD
jgi:hypothetical protein